ncbi:allantoicase [Paraburkholderia sp. RP-4-7]|jgi:allantoicase|uniref:Probable allantoicase n=1 Tax=Paraburkholderia polaris TaxID=2728848 RepID=A0A848I930_9BURK|nr:allantoicase [Paraburkholderia polaris]NML97722.1 allantoicase [Paraburkholderia polaris]
MTSNTNNEALNTWEVDLASRWLGGSVIAASDESFGEKENLLTPTAANFVPGRYNYRGEIVDGWETRRRREGGNDWAVIRLGCPGVITSVDVDTHFFTGNFPEHCLVEACGVEGYPSEKELMSESIEWVQIVPRSALKGDTHNIFQVNDKRRFTHIRLSAFPDGGIARLRVRGQAMPDPRLFDGLTIDLASQDHGGVLVASSDGFYSSASNLNRPDKARTMGEGWETRRRRDDGHDYAVFRLAFPGRVRSIEIDTAHFKYNASGAAALSGCLWTDGAPVDAADWHPLLPKVALQPDTRHVFPQAKPSQLISAVKFDVFPDGGISRLRVWGEIDHQARKKAGNLWWKSMPDNQATQVLIAAGMQPEQAKEISMKRADSVEVMRISDTTVWSRVLRMIEGPGHDG